MMIEPTIQRQTQRALAHLPPEGQEELAQFIEFLSFKYHLTSPTASPAVASTPANVPAYSQTAHFQGFVQSPLTVAELSAAYEFDLSGGS